MNFIKQFLIIIGATFAGEVVYELLGLPIPAGIYGLIILLILLETGIVKTEQVKETGDFLLEILTLTFIPSTVGIITAAEELKQFLIPILLALFVVTVIVFFVTGKTAQFMLERKKK